MAANTKLDKSMHFYFSNWKILFVIYIAGDTD